VAAACCAILATTALLLVLPTANDEARAGSDGVHSTRVSAEPAPTHQPSQSPVNDEASFLLGDDPAEALRALSRVNEGCAATADEAACRTGVFQPDFLASRPADESAVVIDAAEAIVTGSWGGSALVAARLNDEPASFLLVKGEAGWRVRDVFVSE
jgi:hypothetical protein